jgi:hypothetical protein
MPTTLLRPSILVYEFATDARSALPDRLKPWWGCCIDAPAKSLDSGAKTLTMTSGWDADPHGELPGHDLQVLAFRRRPRSSDQDKSLYQAVRARAGNAGCLVALTAPNDDDVSWKDLNEQWLNADHPTPGADLGGVRVYAALVDSPLDDRVADSLAGLIGDAVPYAGEDRGWTRRWSRTARGFLLWEAPRRPLTPVAGRPPGLDVNERRLVLIGSASAERDLDNFSWSSGGQRFGQFVYYALSSVLLRHEQACYHPRFRDIRQHRRDTDAAVDKILELHREAAGRPVALVPTDEALKRLQLDLTDLVSTLAELRRVQRNVEVCIDNMRRAAEASATDDGPLGDDEALAKALCDRLGDDIAYLDNARERAERVTALATATVQRGLSARQQQLTLVQGSLLGAIVMILAGVQAFAPNTDVLDKALEPPLIAVLGGLALTLPGAVLRISRAVPPDVKLRGAYYFGVALLGLSAGWLLGEAAPFDRTGDRLEAPMTWTVALVTGVVFVAVALGHSWLTDRWSRRDRPAERRSGTEGAAS